MAKEKRIISGAIAPNEVRALRDHEITTADKGELIVEPSCSNCSFWLRHDSMGIGQCRRFPPNIVDSSALTELGPLVRFGITRSENVCGEHPLITPTH